MAQGFSQEPGTHGPMEDLPAKGLRRVRLWAWTIAVGGFLFGFDTGVVSGALLFMREEFGLDSVQQSSVVSVLLIGAMIGALGAGRVSDRIGRRWTLALEGAVFVVGTVIIVTANGYGMLIVARVVLGLAVGGASATVPVYLSEISPPPIRGRVLSLNQLMITIGILVSYLVDLAFSSAEDWRAMFAVGFVPAAVIVVGALTVLPESPQWLITHGHIDRARKTIGAVTTEERADELIERARHKREEQQRGGEDQQGARALVARHARPALIVGLTLAAVQQFGGINTIIYYAPTVIEQTGLNASNSIFYSVFIGLINLVMTLVSIRLIDRVGRRPLLTFSLLGMCVSIALLGLAFVADLGSVLTLIFMVLYIAVYAVGLGPVFWVLIGEVFPSHVRAVGSSASTTVNWLSNFVVSLVFLPLATVIGQGETFWIFAVICLLGLLFTARYVPETRGRDFDEVDQELRSRFGDRHPAGQ
ncbi:sugar porter family MFS transporter [Streptomyces reniochalinae]|uniref:Sugar porter family MFS transporter n=1 Tax=Streptomyces reniochalinae TaxID=2250578 RepID=A0A367E6A8_9ACTN|nr:sugar porter family MFS transporter [Streptomyces reniochalinae]RCG13289.1 sugar porter family MFS transporter [Streptomyces reniochalinae]